MVQRTLRIKLNTSAVQAAALHETVVQFTDSFNEVCCIGWDARERNGVRLHHLTYRSLKDRLPDLVSDLHIQARVKATEAVKSALALAKAGRKVSCPHSQLCPPRYNVHTFKVDWEAGIVRLSTTSGRIVVPFVLPDYYRPLTAGNVCTADLILSRRGSWWLHVVVELPDVELKPSTKVIGVDLGITRAAVTSDALFLGERRWRNVEARIFRQKRQCQSKGTKSARRRLRILRGKQARFRRDCDHILSRRIVDSLPDGGTIVMEDLTNIRGRVKARKRQRRRLHGWSFAQLRSFAGYKAEAAGCRLEVVDPRNTSRTCPKCGHCHRSNRKTQSLFRCRQCDHTLNADLAAAINIRGKFLASPGMSPTGRPSSTGPTVLMDQCGEVVSLTCKPPALAGSR